MMKKALRAFVQFLLEKNTNKIITGQALKFSFIDDLK